MKRANTSEDILNHPATECFFRDSDGYWIWLNDGYYSPDMECITIHEQTIKDCCSKLNNVIKTN